MTTTQANAPTSPKATASLPASMMAAWGLVALATVAFVWVMTGVWAATPEMNDRFLIPCASAWVIHRLLPRFRGTPSSPTWWGMVPVALGAAAFIPGWYLLVQVGPRVILLWWLLAALIAAAMGIALLHFGPARARLLLFPLLFCFLALPMPDRIYKPLQRVLQEGTTQTAVKVLPLLGIPVVRQGFVLNLPSGDLGVVEACSGVRSVTALAAIGVLAAFLRGFSLLRGLVLLALTFGIVVASNAVRIVVTGLLQEWLGRAAIEGWAHEVLGVLVILVGLGLIVVVSKLIAPPAQPERKWEPVPEPLLLSGWPAALCLSLALGGCLWSEQFRQSHREVVRLEELPKTLGDWTVERQDKIDELVAEMLKCDELLYRIYTNRLGQDVHVYVMFWATPANTAHMHHPDVCWPARGWEKDTGYVRPVPFAEGKETLPLSIRLFHRGTDRQMVYYWSQNANVLMPDGQDNLDNVSEYGWLLSMLTRRKAVSQVARISVLIGTEMTGPAEVQERILDSVAGPLADAIYALCPWARPEAAEKKPGPGTN